MGTETMSKGGWSQKCPSIAGEGDAFLKPDADISGEVGVPPAESRPLGPWPSSMPPGLPFSSVRVWLGVVQEAGPSGMIMREANGGGGEGARDG